MGKNNENPDVVCEKSYTSPDNEAEPMFFLFLFLFFVFLFLFCFCFFVVFFLGGGGGGGGVLAKFAKKSEVLCQKMFSIKQSRVESMAQIQ